MKFIHTSDSHGAFIPLPKEGEFILHTGDLLPNKTRGIREIERPYQENWIRQNIERFKRWFDGRPFLFVMANHEFTYKTTDILNEYGIEAYSLNLSKFEFKGIRFCGFSFVPYFTGEWAGEMTSSEMANQMPYLKAVLNDGVDIFASHSPISGILDQNGYGEHCGSTHLYNLFNYETEKEKMPKMFCCGHLHEGKGRINIPEWNDMLISNAATTAHILEIEV